jgi:hypothetical protein
MKKALVTETTNSFVFGTKLLLKSFLHYNDFDGDIIVMHSSELRADHRQALSDEFNVIFHECASPSIKFAGTRKWAHNPASRFDIFKLPYDRVIYYDSDILITGDVSEFINNTEDFIACPYTHKMTGDSLRPNDDMSDCNAHLFNAGVFSVSKKYLHWRTYDDLLNIATSYTWPGNQAILNKYFASRCHLMSNIYNLTTSEATNANTIKRSKVLHFVGNNKIWNSGSYFSRFDFGIIHTIGLLNCTRILEQYRKHCILLELA